MFLSVLIPTYNYVCYELVARLQELLNTSQVDYEVIVAEDGSNDATKVSRNQAVALLDRCRHICYPTNVGRARIRNLLVAESKGEWLLFLDSDAEIISNTYISMYLNAIRQHLQYDMIAGGLKHADRCPSPEVSLRYQYEKAADQRRSAEIRNRDPFGQFTVFNVLLKRTVFDQCRFDETCKQYGYEDTLLGLEMADRGLSIVHIDNPVLHAGLEDNTTFLKKTGIALQTLHQLGNKMEGRTKIGQTAQRIREWHLTGLFRWSFNIVEPIIVHNLLSNNPSLHLFAIWKLGTYIK